MEMNTEDGLLKAWNAELLVLLQWEMGEPVNVLEWRHFFGPI